MELNREQIIKALECCTNCTCNHPKTDTECPFVKMSFCKNYLMKQSLALINRQRAEIESLTQNNISTKYPNCVLCSKGVIFTKSLEDYDKLIGDISAEAVKEFAERLETALLVGGIYPVFVKNTIHRLVKEMTGKKECPTCKHFVGCEAACGGRPCDCFDKGDEK